MSRREFGVSLAALLAMHDARLEAADPRGNRPMPLFEFAYGEVTITSDLHEVQVRQTRDLLMNLSEDSLLKPFRQMAGQAAPGEALGGWYTYDPDFDWRTDDAGLAPGATFGQWMSALSRQYAITRSPAIREKVLRLNRLYARTISEGFYEKNRFPAYCFDKLLLGLIDSHQFVHDPDAFAILERTTAAALPHMPRAAVDREVAWRADTDLSFRWDESYTNPENLFLAYQRGAGIRYRDLGIRYLNDVTWFDPLARGENVLASKHAYSYVNSLSSSMQAYLTLGSEKHLRAAENAFTLLLSQSFATGGWGPEEKLAGPQSPALYASLTTSHKSFEAPCGSYAHFKLTRYLLRVTRDSLYGDSMERVMYNTVLGAKPLQADGRAFYYADYNVHGTKEYSTHRFPCCSGTLPQVAADYRINTFFRDPHGIYVNLYVPSTVRWVQGGTQCSMSQHGDYPFVDWVSLVFAASQSAQFAVHLRIPEWATEARIEINGKPWPEKAIPGTFATLYRHWRDGDRIDLQLPRKLRLEPIDLEHSDTVALLCGPLVLFAMTRGAGQLRPTREELLSVRQTARHLWESGTATLPIQFLPYIAITDQEYSTYLHVA